MQWARLTHNTRAAGLLRRRPRRIPSKGKGEGREGGRGRKLKVCDGGEARRRHSSYLLRRTAGAGGQGAEDKQRVPTSLRRRGYLVEPRLMRLHQSKAIMKTASTAERELPARVRDADNAT